MVEVSWPGLEEEGAARLGVGEGSHLSACEGPHLHLGEGRGCMCVSGGDGRCLCAGT